MAKDNEARLELTAIDKATPVIQGVQRSVVALQGAYLSMAAALAGGAVFTAFLTEAIATRSALDDLADTTGDNVKTLDGLRRQANISGVEFERVGGALVKFAKNLNSADDEGQAAAQALQALGLSVAEIRAMKPGEAFVEVSKRLAEFEDGASKVAVAMALMGREGAKQLPLMKDIAEAGGVSGKITAEQAAEAERLEKQWRQLNATLKAGKEGIINGVIPALADITSNLTTAARAGELFWQTMVEGLKLFTATLASLPEFTELGKMGRNMADRLFQWDAQQRAARSGPTGNQILSAFNAGTPGQFGGAAAGSRGKLDFTIQKAAPKGAGERDTSDADTLRSLQEANKILEEAQALGVKFVLQQDAIRQKEEERLAKLRDGYLALIDPTRQYYQNLAEIVDLEARGLLTAEQAGEARYETLLKINQALNVNNDAMERGKSFAEEFGLTFSSAFENAAAGGQGFRQVLRGIEQDIARIIIRKQITEPGGAAITGLLGELFNGKAGSNTVSARQFQTNIDMQGFASGGSFTVGGTGGLDTTPVAFMATPGEKVTVTRPGEAQAPAAAPVVVNLNVSAIDGRSVAQMLSSREGQRVIVGTIQSALNKAGRTSPATV
jgi:hypothetical protein